jgi:hypothetical protein
MYILLAIVFVLISKDAAAQNYFEGTLVFQSYELENGEMEESGAFTLICNQNRMRFITDGEKASSDMLPGIESDQILIRHDKKDFVIFTGSNEALSITKTDIEGLFGMMKAFMGETPDTDTSTEDNVNLTKTGQSETFNGNRASEWIYTGQEGEQVHLWLSENLKINWGMFKEPWFSNMSSELSSPFGRIIDEGYVPLKVEVYKEGDLTMVLETQQVNQQRIPDSELDVPAGITMRTLQQMMMEQFQGRN